MKKKKKCLHGGSNPGSSDCIEVDLDIIRNNMRPT
jgi:hypothetical protein